MTIEELLKLQKELKEKLEKMSPEEREAFLNAARRHSGKVRDELITSHEIQKKREEEEEKNKDSQKKDDSTSSE